MGVSYKVIHVKVQRLAMFFAAVFIIAIVVSAVAGVRFRFVAKCDAPMMKVAKKLSRYDMGGSRYGATMEEFAAL